MINFNPLLTKEQAQYIIEQVFPVFSHRISHPTLSKIMEGHNLAFKEQVSIPGCGCEYKATHAVWTSRLSQYEQQIRDIAYPVEIKSVNKVGRKSTAKGTTGIDG